MKYLFINSVAGFGSTGRIAAEKCRELMGQGQECVLAFGREKANCDDLQTVQIGSALDCKLHGLRNRLLDDHGFGSRAATRKFLAWVREYDPDVIWLHNVHGYYIHIGELFSYLRTCGKRIFWTLHDCWAFTGHCAYFDFARCEKWKSGCHSCPNKKEYPASLFKDNSSWNYRKKKELFTGIPNLSLVVPSCWLKARVEQSFLKDYPVEVVYNTIDTRIFKPTLGPFREKQNLQGKKIILGVASVWDGRKGLSDFLELAKLLDERYKIVLVGLREDQIAALPEEVLGLPRTNSMEELAQIYSAADLFLNPSTEETFGMTAMEARCCGTEAIVYKNTACEEIVDAFGGIAVEWGAQHILQAIRNLEKEGKL